ncbi:MAG TPA: hypothetical protein DCR93_37165, partial [Cytophagales bacterium]|nr:hypothetical protein [Cytophagales bacterium]
MQVAVQTATLTDDHKHQQLQGLVDQACEDVRGLAHRLHAGIGDDFGLAPAVEALTEALRQSDGIQVEISIDLPPDTLTITQEVTVYRMIQELLSNVLKHAQATLVSIQVAGFDTLLNLMVEDNGRGFDPA